MASRSSLSFPNTLTVQIARHRVVCGKEDGRMVPDNTQLGKKRKEG
jgi:hypothetical protein